MILGMSTSTFTLFHVVLSLAGIGAGFIVMFGLLAGNRLDGWTAIFIAASMATSVTGFLFPFEKLLPSHLLGLLSLLVLVVAIWARCWFQMAGVWRWIYVVSAATALYLNVFVAIVQAFRRVPALKAMAPTQTEPPFVIAQLLNLGIFVVLTILAGKRFRVDRRWTA
jgi:hypothetical protein